MPLSIHTILMPLKPQFIGKSFLKLPCFAIGEFLSICWVKFFTRCNASTIILLLLVYYSYSLSKPIFYQRYYNK
jgi:hypothetical protein